MVVICHWDVYLGSLKSITTPTGSVSAGLTLPPLTGGPSPKIQAPSQPGPNNALKLMKKIIAAAKIKVKTLIPRILS